MAIHFVYYEPIIFFITFNSWPWKISNFVRLYTACLWSWNSHNIIVTYSKHKWQDTKKKKKMSARFNKILFYVLAGSFRHDGKNSFPYHSYGSPGLQRSNSKMSCKWKIREFHLWLDVTGTRIRHYSSGTSLYMRIQVSRRQSMPKF